MYNFKSIEKKWQKYWEKNKTYKTKGIGKKYYVLEMLPYPSGNLHMGHVRNYTIGDAIARFKMMDGYDVLHPMGWDAFGLPAENAAIEHNEIPSKWTLSNISNMKKQLKSLGLSYDWDREITTCDPSYYRHQQKLFIDLYKKDLVYQKESFVNWDPIENTVLANEQVIDGRGWRSNAVVEKKKLKQWFVKITDYADELLNDLKNLENKWPDKVLKMQEQWIGKSKGAYIDFKVKDLDYKIKVYTTRPETIFGASFIAISIHHPFASQLKNHELSNFIKECEHTSTDEKTLETNEKKGFDTKYLAIHPFDKSIKIPIYVSNFVLIEYGTGAIFGCPAHDERDFEFAKKYNLKILPVITHEILPHTDLSGKMINSQFLDDLDVFEAKEEIIKEIDAKKVGKSTTQYRIRDWGVSRQRFWGCPIPIIYCKKCGIVIDENLPIKLPDDVDFSKKGNPLDNHPTWKNTNCPKCNNDAIRETDTLDTFFDSSWYFLRYICPDYKDPIDSDEVNEWMPVDWYIGGIEHAVMHLLYARFFTKALRDLRYLNFSEPFEKLLTQGMVCHPTFQTKDGKWLYPKEAKNISDAKIGRSEKMSKSKKNTIDPKDIIDSYGVDAVRMFILSDTPPDKDFDWNEDSLESCWRYINKIYKIGVALINYCKNDEKLYANEFKIANKYLYLIEKDYDNNAFNKVIAHHRELSKHINEKFDLNKKFDSKECDACNINIAKIIEIYIKTIEPIIPHIANELNEMFFKLQKIDMKSWIWPKLNKNLLKEESIIMVIQVNGKKRGLIEVSKNKSEDEIKNLSKEKVSKYLNNQDIKKVIFVKNRMVNFVI